MHTHTVSHTSGASHHRRGAAQPGPIFSLLKPGQEAAPETGREPQRHESDEALNPRSPQSAQTPRGAPVGASPGSGAAANPMRPPPRDAEEIGGKSLVVNESIINQSWVGRGERGRLRTLSATCAPLQRRFRRTGGRGRPAYRPRRSAAGERAPAGEAALGLGEAPV
jgi:hypothetical protein